MYATLPFPQGEFGIRNESHALELASCSCKSGTRLPCGLTKRCNNSSACGLWHPVLPPAIGTNAIRVGQPLHAATETYAARETTLAHVAVPLIALPAHRRESRGTGSTTNGFLRKLPILTVEKSKTSRRRLSRRMTGRHGGRPVAPGKNGCRFFPPYHPFG